MEKPKQVLLVTSEDRIAAFPLLPNADKKSCDLKLVTLDEVDALRNEGYKFPTDISEGSIFMFNPFVSNTYVPIDIENKFEVMKDKRQRITEIAMQLGCQKIAFELYQKSLKVEKRDVNVKGKIKGWDVGVTSKATKTEELQNKSRYCYTGGTYNNKEREKLFEGAKKLLDEYPTLRDDKEIQRMMRFRDPINPLKIGSETFMFDMTSEINSALNVAATLKYVDPNILNLSVGVRKEINTKTTFSLRCIYIWDEKYTDEKSRQQFEIMQDRYNKALDQ